MVVSSIRNRPEENIRDLDDADNQDSVERTSRIDKKKPALTTTRRKKYENAGRRIAWNRLLDIVLV